MKKQTTLGLIALTLGVALLVPRPAHATDLLTLTLDDPFQEVQPGSTSVLTFTANAATPITNAATVFLNGDSSSIDFPLTLDDSGFFFGFPLSLDPGQSFDSVLFTVTVPATAPGGTTYNGFFEILSGANDGASDVLATAQFQVAVPEHASSLALLAAGLAVLAAIEIRRRQSVFFKP